MKNKQTATTLSVDQLAAAVNIHRTTVYREIRKGNLVPLSITPRYHRFLPSEIDRWLNRAVPEDSPVRFRLDVPSLTVVSEPPKT